MDCLDFEYVIAAQVERHLAALPPDQRARAALRLAACLVEVTAYECARDGVAAHAPPLILMADRLQNLAALSPSDTAA